MRYFHGALLEKLGDTDAAVAEMEKILEKSPNHADALNFVAYTWTVQGVHLKDAEEMLKRAMKLKPNNPFILDSFGWNQFVLGKQESALRYLEKAVGIKGDEETILQHLVEVYAKNQMPDRARETRGRIESLQIKEASRVPASVDQK
jgi:Tfp pilus assembly protein PilF